jgi:hypothetical protein
MQTYSNVNSILRQGKAGRIVMYVGLAISAGAVVLVFRDPTMFFPALIAVIVGTVLSQVGGIFYGRFGRSPRLDEVLLSGLKGLSEEYTIFQHYLRVENTLITPAGIFALSPQLEEGKIEYVDGAWRQTAERRFPIRRMATKKLKSVEADAEALSRKLKRQMQLEFPDRALDIQPMIVFLHHNADISAGESPVPATHLKKMKSALRQLSKGRTLSPAEIQQLAAKVNASPQE